MDQHGGVGDGAEGKGGGRMTAALQLAFFNDNLNRKTKREAEKLLSSYKNLDAIIESKKIDFSSKMTVNYQTSESQRGNQFHSEAERMTFVKLDIEEYILTKRKLDLVYESLKPIQQRIWELRYMVGKYDVDVYEELGVDHRKYYRLKREMIAIVADAFNLMS